jgi:hypothetical protein
VTPNPRIYFDFRRRRRALTAPVPAATRDASRLAQPPQPASNVWQKVDVSARIRGRWGDGLEPVELVVRWPTRAAHLARNDNLGPDRGACSARSATGRRADETARRFLVAARPPRRKARVRRSYGAKLVERSRRKRPHSLRTGISPERRIEEILPRARLDVPAWSHDDRRFARQRAPRRCSTRTE